MGFYFLCLLREMGIRTGAGVNEGPVWPQNRADRAPVEGARYESLTLLSDKKALTHAALFSRFEAAPLYFAHCPDIYRLIARKQTLVTAAPTAIAPTACRAFMPLEAASAPLFCTRQSIA